MKFDTKQIAASLKKQIEDFLSDTSKKEVGSVISVGDDIAAVYGLPGAMLGELLLFPGGHYGLVMNLSEDSIDCALLNGEGDIKEGDYVYRTKKVVEVPVGDALLGRVMGALGNPIDGKGEIITSAFRPVERVAPSIMRRQGIDTPLITGIRAIDAMIPIGRGQRELVIGDRQTGKTAIAIDAIVAQKDTGVKCIYCAIGQKTSSVAYLVDVLQKLGCLDYTCVVTASSSEPAPQLYLAPYSAMAMAEEWMEKGEDVLVVFDDLSKHAIAYRTLSLLLRRSPGREAYPGDIFYLHSRLLERACRLSAKEGGGSITALPIIETQEGDFSAYIPTNVISITDGQIYLNNDLFNSGHRPAIDSGLSVSRVGSNAQHPCMKKVGGGMKIDLASYQENLAFSQFGSDLDSDTRAILTHGGVLDAALVQKNRHPEKEEKQAIILYAVREGLFDEIAPHDIPSFLEGFYFYGSAAKPGLIRRIAETHDLDREAMAEIRELATDYLKEHQED